MKIRRPYRPQPLIVAAPTLRDSADQLADLARLWSAFTGREVHRV